MTGAVFASNARKSRSTGTVTLQADTSADMTVTEFEIAETEQRLGMAQHLADLAIAATGVPVFTDLSSSNPAAPGYATWNLCTGQCWYDLFVVTPKGHPDVVYAGGSSSPIPTYLPSKPGP